MYLFRLKINDIYRIWKQFYSYRRKKKSKTDLSVRWCFLVLLSSLQSWLSYFWCTLGTFCFVPFWKLLFHLLCILASFGKMLEKGTYTPWCATLVRKRLSLAEINVYVHAVPRSAAHRSFWMYVDRLLVGCSRSGTFQRHWTLSLHRKHVQDLQGNAQSPDIQTRGHSPAVGGQVSAGTQAQGTSCLGSFPHLK